MSRLCFRKAGFLRRERDEKVSARVVFQKMAETLDKTEKCEYYSNLGVTLLY